MLCGLRTRKMKTAGAAAKLEAAGDRPPRMGPYFSVFPFLSFHHRYQKKPTIEPMKMTRKTITQIMLTVSAGAFAASISFAAANRGLDIRNSVTADRNLDIRLQSGNPLVDQAPGQPGQEAGTESCSCKSHPGVFSILHQAYTTLTKLVHIS